MGLDNKNKVSPNQTDNFEVLKSEFGAFQNATHEQVFSEFLNQQQKINTDLTEGFSIWVDENSTGHTVIYNRNDDKALFIVSKTIIDGRAVSQEIFGKYNIGKKEVSISLKNVLGSPFVSCYVFLDSSLIASRTSPADWAGQQADAFLKNSVESRGEDSTRLDKTVRDDRSPYPFAQKMLSDFANSKPDKKETERMFNYMKENKKNTVVWNTEYRFS